MPASAPERLRTEYLINPVGIDELTPRLSWWLSDDRPAELQTGYQVLAASSTQLLRDDDGDLWNSGRVESNETHHIEYQGTRLKSLQGVWWKVRTYDSDGLASVWSDAAYFEVGLLEPGDWRGHWIASPLMGSRNLGAPVPALRRSFTVTGKIQRARLVITALGVYEAHINGVRVGENVLSPGWTDYYTHLRYQVYEITGHLAQGENAIGVMLGDGWYCGHVGASDRQNYGDRPALFGQIYLEFVDGKVEIIATDHQWKWQRSSILSSDLLVGETVDGRQSLGEWTRPEFDTRGWMPIEIVPRPEICLQATNSPSIRAIRKIAPCGKAAAVQSHTWIYDFGQNLVGRVRIRVNADAGVLIRLRHGERLTESGHLYTDNLGDAKATDYYTCGGGEEVFEPSFTFHGFQYLEVSGKLNFENILDVAAIVLSSNLEETGEFRCDHSLVNQLQSNIQWSQRGNFLDVPTDCPQRSERLGWTGDAQMFARTAAFNLDINAFFSKWLQDLSVAQRSDGVVRPVAPFPPGLKQLDMDGGPAWSDAMVICPWTMYRCYGDRRVLERHYGGMRAFVCNLEQRFPNLIRGAPGLESWQGFGDWLAPDPAEHGEPRFGRTPKELIGTAYFFYSAKLLARVAGVLGNLSDLEAFEELAQRIKAAFHNRFVTQEGLLLGGTQTAYVLALHFGLLVGDQRQKALTALVADIEERDYHLATGFVGTPHLLGVLTDGGRLDVAYRLLLQTTSPSWLYPITRGATTIWERWDGWTEDKGFQSASMNSFNHYVYGAVGEWLYATVAGLDLDMNLGEENNAYRRVIIHPRPPLGLGFQDGPPIRMAEVGLDTINGRYEVSWEITDNEFSLRAMVPANCSAQIILPDDSVHEVVAGFHEFSIAMHEGIDGIPILREVQDIA